MMLDVSMENYNFQKIVFVVGAILLIVKFVAYFLTNSVAIFTDAVESIVNVVAGAMGLYALYLSAQPPDKSHPFGHGRVELISATVEGSMIAVAGVMIIFESIRSLIEPREISSLDYGLLLIIFAALVNLIIGKIAVRIGKKNRSVALEASGKHLQTDTLSSLGIIVALAIIFIGKNFYDKDWSILDPIVALCLGAFIIITGSGVIRKAMDGIMDKADAEILEKIVGSLNENRSDDWIDIHNLRVIKYGSKLHVEMHVTLPFDMTITEMERENYHIHESVETMFGESVDLTMMPEPCKEFSCIHCKRVCRARRALFIESINWNVNLLAQEHQHAYGNHVVIRNIDKGEL